MERFPASPNGKNELYEHKLAIKLGSISRREFERDTMRAIYQLGDIAPDEEKVLFKLPEDSLIKRIDFLKQNDEIKNVIIYDKNSSLSISQAGWIDTKNPKRIIDHATVINALENGSHSMPSSLLDSPINDDQYSEQILKSLSANQRPETTSRVITYATNRYMVDNEFFNETSSRLQVSLKAGKLAAMLVETSTPFDIDSTTVTKTVQRVATNQDAGQATIRYSSAEPVGFFATHDNATAESISEITSDVINGIIEDKLID